MDVANWAEKHLAKWRWVHVIAGFVVAAAAVFLMSMPVAERSIQSGRVADKGGNVPGVISHLYNRRDARGFIPQRPRAKKDDVFDLMIVADSSFLIINPPPEYAHKKLKRFTLTKMIARHIHRIGGKKLRIHEYYQDGTRTAATRRALLHGLTDPNIDAVVMALNPFLYFNDFMSYDITTQRSKLLYMDGLEISDYTQLATTLRPSDLLMDALSVISPLHERRYVISQMALSAMQRTLSSGVPFPLFKLPPREVIYMIHEWVKWLYPPEVGAKVLKSGSNVFYSSAIQANNLGLGSIGEMTLRANLRTLEKWGKPAILYVPPINPEYLKNPNWPMMQQIIKRFDLIADQHGAKNVKIVTDTATKAYKPVLYHDAYHMKSGQGFVRQFADMLEKHLGMPIIRRNVRHMFGPGS